MNTGKTATLLASLALCASLLPLAGCSSFEYDAVSPAKVGEIDIRLALLAPIDNATDDEHAGRAVTEMVGTALFERGIPVHQTEYSRMRLNEAKAAGPDGRYPGMAATTGASHIILGTVHEFRYKTDLDGDPAVSVTLRVIDAKTGRTVWQGTAGNVGYVFASLSSSAQSTVRDLVGRIPLADPDDRKPEPAPESAAPATSPAPAPASAPAATPAPAAATPGR